VLRAATAAARRVGRLPAAVTSTTSSGAAPSRARDTTGWPSSEVEFPEWVGHAIRVGTQDPGRRFLGKIEAVPLDVGVGLVEQRQVVRVAVGDVVADVRCEANGTVVERSGPAHEGDAAGGEGAEVDGVAAVHATDRDGDMLRALGNVTSTPHRPPGGDRLRGGGLTAAPAVTCAP